MFSSKSFIVLALTFRYLIPFELIFVYGTRIKLHIFLHMVIQFSQHHLSKTVLSLLSDLGTFLENQMVIDRRVYFWALHTIPLACMSVFMSVSHCFDYHDFVVSFEIKKCEISNFFPLLVLKFLKFN